MKAILCLFGAFLLASCKSGSDTSTNNSKGDSDPVSDRNLSDRKPGKSDIVIIETSMGTIRAKLDPANAPVTVANFLSYVDQAYYDNTIFHRVIPTFMIQGGGFQIDGEFPKEKETGSGITNESAQTHSNSCGTLAMARTNDPNSATAQFFINVGDNTNLDHPNMGGYAVFGKVVDGMDVVDAIKVVPTAEKMALSLGSDGRFTASPFTDVPVDPVTILSIRREQ